ncbi:hypothetical protein [Proteus vulgaris]|uniref:hypothetical protein n=1 Tax=Proteus vulgaris TaxID=585 RepID=UPI0034D61BC1
MAVSGYLFLSTIITFGSLSFIDALTEGLLSKSLAVFPLMAVDITVIPVFLPAPVIPMPSSPSLPHNAILTSGGAALKIAAAVKSFSYLIRLTNSFRSSALNESTHVIHFKESA